MGLRAVTAGIGLSLAAATLVHAPAAHAAPVSIQILGTNDFHGRLLPESGGVAGAAKLAGVVTQLESENPNTVFAAAGDLIGASTFESFIQQDKPTIDALNAANLDVSAAGNHEFDQGYNDLVNRVMAAESPTNPRGGAEWQYIAANVRKKSDGSYALPGMTAQSNGAYWYEDMAGVRVGFVGAVTEDLPSLVTPAGIADIAVTNIVTEVNAAADTLTTTLGADLVVLLVHEGAATTSIASATDPNSMFGKIVLGVDSDVDAIVSGHTHLAYNHLINGRPVVSAGQYGTFLNKLVFTVDPVAETVSLDSQSIVPIATTPVTDPAAVAVQNDVQAIVDAAVADANVLGAVELGKIGGAFNRARSADNTENRGGESTLGNLVAEVQQWATEGANRGGAQIAFMNPGGLRADMVGNNASGYPATVTYRQAANVQPFANTLVNMRLTGAQIRVVLEQQWQPAGAARPFLRLGVSEGFKYTYDPTKPAGQRIRTIWLHGTTIDPAASYSVTVNSFLASGGDNFTTFAQGAQKKDTGMVDLQGMVDYLAAFAKTTALPVDYKQRAMGLTMPADAPRRYVATRNVSFNLSSWAFSTAADKLDAQVTVALEGGRVIGTFPVDNTIGNDKFDEWGKVAVVAKLPANVKPGAHVLTVKGKTTGSTVDVPIKVKKAKASMTVVRRPDRVRVDRTEPRLKVKVVSELLEAVKGQVTVKTAGRTYKGTLEDGKVKLKLRAYGETGKKKVVVKYLGNIRTRATKEVLYIRVRRH